MKLFNFHESTLSEIRKKIWADLIIYNTINWKPRLAEIIKIDPSSMGISNIDYTITNNKWERIIVYIRDWSNFYYETKWSLPKIHFYNCKTIQEMMKKNAFDSRYVWAYTTSGLLSINLINKNKTIEGKNLDFELNVCSNCLKEADSDWLIDKNLIKPFNLKKYFDFYEYFRNRVNSPKYNFITISKNQYPSNWEEISKIERKKVWYICQWTWCWLDFSNNKWKLHVHHKDHNKWNNFTDNFEVLCYECHSKYHNHM